MTDSRRELLACLVRADEEGEVPLQATEIATALEDEPSRVRENLDRLAAMELVAAAEDGYRPTITGRELLELDLQGETVVVDASAEPRNESHRHR